MREMYKRGPGAPLRVLLGDEGAADALRGVRYAALLNERDAKTLGRFRDDAALLASERESLAAERERLQAARTEMEEASGALARSRAEQASYLASIRRDRRKSEEAIRDIESASRALGELAGDAVGSPEAARREIDPSRLRGRLEWPLSGKVSAGFGKVVHPQFKTVVPHPGLDIEATEGTDFRAVLRGRVVYSAPLRGYGLTVLVEHGGGLVSVYGHAAVLLVEEGETVEQGQVLGKVGDTGSLRGPFLYFELRQDGRPIDPQPWLRRR
jgi:septal ring factor EnvC (AmiA/AmiB activator)